MKKRPMIVLFATLFISQLTCAFDEGAALGSGEGQFNMGITVLTDKTKSNGEFTANAVAFIEFEGVEFNPQERMHIKLIPTDARVSVKGKPMTVYADLATLTYYKFDDIDLIARAISLDYGKNNDYHLTQKKKVSILGLNAIKYIPIREMDLDISLGLSAFGTLDLETSLDDGNHRLEDKHYYTADITTGLNIPISTSKLELDLYVYAGRSRQVGKESQIDSTYTGVSLIGAMITDRISYTPRVEYVSEKTSFDSRNDVLNDSRMIFAIDLNYLF